MKSSALAPLFLVGMLGTASAGGQSDSLGVGAEVTLHGEVGGISANYDMGDFHVGGFFGFADGGGDDDTDYTLGARFYYHVHSTAMSDFGVGGAFSLYSADGVDRQSRMYLDPGFQIRLFLASNVAMSFSAGVSIAFVDADGFSVGGQGTGTTLGDESLGLNMITGAAGIHYYFF